MDDHDASQDPVLDISAGGSHSVAILGNRSVASWGSGEEGQLGHGDADDLTAPKVVDALRSVCVTAVICGAQHTVAVSDGEVYSWGWGDFGRLGHGRGDDMFQPQPIPFFSGMPVKQVACGDSHSLVLTGAGELYSFGRGQNGQLGLGHTNDCLAPQLVGSFKGHVVESVAAGSEYSMALLQDGQIFSFGWGSYGNLGDGYCVDRHTPTLVVGLSGLRVRSVQCGWRHSVVLTDEGVLYTFGWNKFGQLGLGSSSEICPTAQRIGELPGGPIASVSCGWRHTLAIDGKGTMYAWGWNKFGQLGLSDLEDRSAPQRVTAGLQDDDVIAKVACGWRHSLALTDRGRVYSWGRGVNGQLGHGSLEDLCTPTLMAPGLFQCAAPADGQRGSDDDDCRVPEFVTEVPRSVGCVPDSRDPVPAAPSVVVFPSAGGTGNKRLREGVAAD